MATGQPVHDVRHAIEWPDGHRVLLSINAAPLFDEAGQVHGMVATVDDVTERVRSEQERAKAEEALRESEMRYRTLFERANDAIFLMRHEQIIDCNRAAEVMLDRPRGDIVGGTPYQFSPPHQPDGRDSRETALEKGDAVLAGIPQSFEWVHCRPDDSLVSTEVSLTRMDLEGELLILAIVRDITERKQIEEALRKREAHQALVLGSLPMAFYTAHPFGDYGGTWVSDQIDHLVGFTAEEFVADTHLWASRLHPEDSERVLDAFERLPDTGALETEYRWQAADGEYVWLLDRAVLTRDKEGQPREIIGTWLDITDRKRTEEEREQLLTQIQEQAQQLQQVMDSVPEGVILLDDKARIVLANPLGRTHLGILADTLVGGTLTRLGDRPLPEILASPPQGLWHDIAVEGRCFQIIARPIETGPVPGGWALVVRDVTQQLEFERRAQQQERLAAVGQLAAGIAHDFNNIMAVITLYANMSLRLPDLPPRLYKRLQTIDEEARRASELIQQIMDFSRRAVLERGPMDLLVFVKEQTRLLQRTLPESIIVSLSYGKDEYTIRADPTRIQQAIMNLATNARDAMPEGGQLRISLDLMRVEQDEMGPVPEMQAGEWVCVEMADTGAGIPEDVLPHIYDPFFTTKEPGKGTGLGLAQVYGIVKQHEGHIDVRTIEGEGTTFIIYLPALTVAGAATPPAEIKDLPKGEGQTILLVEDDARTRAAMVSSLELLGYEVLETANGREALEVLEHHASQIALVLSDMVMPEMGGRVLFQELTRLHPGTKVMLMSGHPMEEGALEQLRAEGLTGWLPKPPDLARLAEAIAQALPDDA
jgi:two-component system cell cycle sensor histidine kinase/response regulator CckA